MFFMGEVGAFPNIPILDSWTVSCYFVWKLPNYENDTDLHVLVQGKSKTGGAVVVKGNKLGAFD